MKRVLISAYACIPGHGSEEGNGWQYASRISQHNCQVWCLTRPIGKTAIEQALQQRPHPTLTVVYVDPPNWVNRVYGWGLIGLYFHYLYWQWAAWQVAYRLADEHSFDLVHHVSYGSLQLGSFLYKLNRPFIFGPVGGGQHAPPGFRSYFKHYWYKEQLRTVVSTLLLHFNPACFESVQRASRVLVWNEDTRRMVYSMGRTTGVVKAFSGIAESFMPAEPLWRQPGEVLQLVWVGRLLPRKALELTLHALSKVDSRVPVHLTVVGDGEMGQYMPDYLNTYGLHNRVSWVGQVPHERVTHYYRQADVFFFTSLRDTGPAQLIEAMAYSLPVITLNLHGQAELVTQATGIRVDVTDAETVTTELARAVEWMYHHPDERIAMGVDAFTYAQEQAWTRKIAWLVDSCYGIRGRMAQ